MTSHSDIIGGSSAKRRLNCTASAALEKKVKERTKAAGGQVESSEWADEGTMLHEVMYELLDKGMHPDEYPDLEEEHRDKIQRAYDAIQELFSRYKVEKFDLELQYEHVKTAPGCFGTLDVVGLGARGELIVADFKFGQGVYEDPAENYQLAFYALGLYDNDDDFVQEAREIIFAIVQPWRDPDAPVLKLWGTDISWLEQYRQLEARKYGEITRGNTFYVAGDWCQFCLGRPECPEQNGGLVQIGSLERTPGEMTDTELSNLLTLGKQAVAQYKVLCEYAERRAMQEGKCPPGYKLVESVGNRTWTDPKAAELELAPKLGHDTYTKKLKSPTQIRDLAKKDARVDYADLEERLVTRPSRGYKLVEDKDSRPAASTGDISAPQIEKLKE